MYGIAAFKMQVDGQHTEILIPVLFILRDVFRFLPILPVHLLQVDARTGQENR